MIRVLFVCLGNICRSPMAEAVFMHLVREAGLEREIKADSAGTADWEIDSNPPHPETLAILQRYGIFYNGKARRILKTDLDDFDYIVTMDDDNFRRVRGLGESRAQVFPLLSFVPDAGYSEVPDPYFDHRFDIVYRLVSAGAEGLLKHIRMEHQLS